MKWHVDNYCEPTFGISQGPAVLTVHDPELCKGRWCVVHNPSDHHMRSWPIQYRADKGVAERVCEHGVGHPDPDDLLYRIVNHLDLPTHGCDFCCAGDS